MMPKKLVKNAATQVEVDLTLTVPRNPEPKAAIRFQGPPIAALLFAMTRATSVPASNQVMSQTQSDSMKYNKTLYNFTKKDGAAGNGIDVFSAFIAANPGLLVNLAAAQALYAAFKKYATDNQIWDDTCELTYDMLDYIAEIDWRNAMPS
jgi:hypothetical protein